MSDQWPPPAPGVNKAFKKAHDATNDNTPRKDGSSIVTKKEIERLEQQRSKAASQLNLNPPGMKARAAADEKRERDIARMKETLRRAKDKTRDDFQRNL